MAAAAAGGANDDKWWNCDDCLRKDACVAHVPDMVGNSGRNSIQKQVNAAEAKLRELQLLVNALRAPLQRPKDAAATGSPTLVVEHSGWMDDNEEGWEEGRLSVSLAADCSSFTRELGAALRAAMRMVKLSFGDSIPCPFSCFYSDNVKIPEKVADLFPNLKDTPGYGNKKLRPGAVLYYPARHRLEIYTRKCKLDEQGKGAKLLGFLLKDGLKSLSYRHTPNKRSIRFCVYCKRYNYVSIEFEKVELLGIAGLVATHDLDRRVDPAVDDDESSIEDVDLEQFEDYFYCDLCHERAKENQLDSDCDCDDSDCDHSNGGEVGYWRILPP